MFHGDLKVLFICILIVWLENNEILKLKLQTQAWNRIHILNQHKLAPSLQTQQLDLQTGEHI